MIQPIPGNPLEDKIKVTLNGGKNELDCAIVPFTFGLDEKVINKKPTHVLVIDRTFQQANSDSLWLSKHQQTNSGRRYFFDLSNPGSHFIEFFKSGEHNLIFVFFSFTEEREFNKKRASEYQDYYLRKSKSYKHLYDNYICTYELSMESGGVIGFCEKDVFIPSEFFSQVPRSVASKMFYDWVNKWRREKPLDDCDFRDRVWRALTYELILRIPHFIITVLLFFIARIFLAIFMSLFSLIFKSISFIVGYQNKNFLKGLGSVWTEFVFTKTPTMSTVFTSFDLIDKIDDADAIYDYKEVRLKNKTINIPISIIGAIVLIYNLHGLVLCASHFAIYKYASLFFFHAIWLAIQIPLIIETSKYVEKLRNTKLFTLQFSYRNDNGTYKRYDLFSKSAVKTCIGLAIIFIVYQLFAFGIFSLLGHSLYVVFTNKISLIIIAFMTAAVLFGLNGKKSVKAVKKYSVKFLLFIWKALGIIFKPLNILLIKLFDKFDAYLYKKFPPNQIVKKESSGDEYKDWLSSSYNFDRDLKTVTASTLPKAQTAKGRVVQTFRTTFWKTKAQICKPYEH